MTNYDFIIDKNNINIIQSFKNFNIIKLAINFFEENIIILTIYYIIIYLN